MSSGKGIEGEFRCNLVLEAHGHNHTQIGKARVHEAGDLVICKLSRDQYKEIDRANLLPPTGDAFGRDVVWSHPAFANKCVYVRNDKEMVCFSLAK
ncbi:MAG TPA: hypothetical protein VM165_08600 [Planctomycetaceae bacterium]|nr:hypothetical protein [Planctomycetaceae bacterium]